jgi:diacylglycerol O-acyltransferase
VGWRLEYNDRRECQFKAGKGMRKIDLSDASFLFLEKRETPMHVAGLLLCTLPEKAGQRQFMASLDRLFRNVGEFRKPFGEYVTTGKAGPLGGLYWAQDHDLDFDYHVRHAALPKPGRYRELFALVSRLHGTLLDRSRPLWEVYLIEGLQNRQIAVYLKMHHAAIDGVSGIQMVNTFCTTNKRKRVKHSPLSVEAYGNDNGKSIADRPRVARPERRELTAVFDVIRQQFDTSLNLAGVAGKFARTWLGGGDGLAVPFHQVPRTPISSRISGARRFVAQSWSIARVKAVGEALDGTLNDVVLAMCSGALRRYLTAHSTLPKQSLKALVPVSIRDKNDVGGGNAIGSITADLATHVGDPEKRFRRIQESMIAGKALLNGLSAREAELLWQLTQAPALLVSILGIPDRFPAVSLTVSNVPGSPQQLYLNGASVDGIYPVNIPFDGMAMSITLVSYRDQLDFGIIACRRSVPALQRMIDYLDESLAELERVVA